MHWVWSFQPQARRLHHAQHEQQPQQQVVGCPFPVELQ